MIQGMTPSMSTSPKRIEENGYPRLANRVRKLEKEQIHARGRTYAKRQWVTIVTVTAIEIPDWLLKKAMRGFSRSKQHVWFRGRFRRNAKALMELDKAAGGSPEWDKVEYRRCEVCSRPLLNLDAEARRKLVESVTNGRQRACGPECSGVVPGGNTNGSTKSAR